MRRRRPLIAAERGGHVDGAEALGGRGGASRRRHDRRAPPLSLSTPAKEERRRVTVPTSA
jgi:hypothetical protein